MGVARSHLGDRSPASSKRVSSFLAVDTWAIRAVVPEASVHRTLVQEAPEVRVRHDPSKLNDQRTRHVQHTRREQIFSPGQQKPSGVCGQRDELGDETTVEAGLRLWCGSRRCTHLTNFPETLKVGERFLQCLARRRCEWMRQRGLWRPLFSRKCWSLATPGEVSATVGNVGAMMKE